MAETARFASPRGVNPQGIDVVDLDSERARLSQHGLCRTDLCVGVTRRPNIDPAGPTIDSAYGLDSIRYRAGHRSET
jgi:hypothetical protein